MNKLEISQAIKQEMSDFFIRFKFVDDTIASININSDKWSLKQIIGHLIDSVSNNHQRIVRLQLDTNIVFPDYKRDEWLSVVNYNSHKYSELLSILSEYNYFISSIIKDINDGTLENKWLIKWSEAKDYISLQELIEHYLWHLKEHFTQFENRLSELKNGNYT